MVLAIGGVGVYYLSLNQHANVIELIVLFSYVLVAAASGGHLLVLVTTTLNLLREEAAWKNKRGPAKNTLGRRRLEAYGNMERQQGRYLDLKSRDEAVVDELIGVLGNALLGARRRAVSPAARGARAERAERYRTPISTPARSAREETV